MVKFGKEGTQIMAAPNTLGLDDDLDGVELLESLETSFGVQFSDKEAEDCWTVGDIFTLLQSYLVRDGRSGAGCASAMAFYRLRRTLAESSLQPRLTPTTPLKDVSTLPPKVMFERLREDAKMRLPRLSFSLAGQLGLVLLWIGGVGIVLIAATAPHWTVYAGLAGAAGAILMRVDRRRFPDACQSLGDLARKVAALNYAALVAAGANYREKDVWSALVEILAEHSSIPKSEIREETVLLQSQVRGV